MSETQTTPEAIWSRMEAHSRFLTVSISSGRLANELGCSTSTVQNYLRRMESQGWIEFIREPTYDRPGTYRLVPPESRQVRGGRRLEDLVTSKWPLKALKTLVAMWNEGHSTARIGLRLGQTKNAIVGKSHRLIDHGVIQSRETPIVRDGKRRPKGPPRPASAVTLPPLPSRQESPITLTPVPKFKGNPNSTFGLRVSARPTFIDFRSSLPRTEPRPKFVADKGYPLGPSQSPCQWPVRDGSVTVPWVFCGVTRAAWPYCTAHMKRAYGRQAEALKA